MGDTCRGDIHTSKERKATVCIARAVISREDRDEDMKEERMVQDETTNMRCTHYVPREFEEPFVQLNAEREETDV